jgi:putative aldouronate transport system permease protein
MIKNKDISDLVLVYFAYFICIFAGVITLYPFIYVLSMAISEPKYVIAQSVWLLPKGFSLQALKIVINNQGLLRSYYNTIWYTVVGTTINVIMTLLAAYPLSRKKFFLKKPITFIITFTMFFGGGLIPSFILINKLGLYNTRWAIVLPGAVAAWYIIIARTFFNNIPDSMHESPKLDGAGEFRILMSIYMPLSIPLIAVLTLFYAVGHWNSYFSALLYLPNKKLQPLQVLLMNVLTKEASDTIMMSADPAMARSDRSLVAIQIRYAVIMVVITPIIIVYPFLQKYFVKGVMIGAIKE